jgi:hypothetical protein
MGGVRMHAARRKGTGIIARRFLTGKDKKPRWF